MRFNNQLVISQRPSAAISEVRAARPDRSRWFSLPLESVLFSLLVLFLSGHSPLQAAPIPANSKVLFLGAGATTYRTSFNSLYAGDASVTAQNITSAAFDITSSVLNDFYNGRSSVTVKNALMTELDKDYDYIVFVDKLDYVQNKPELHMESARILKSYTRNMGTQVVIPMLWTSSNAVANTATLENHQYRISDALGLACVPVGLTWRSIRNDSTLGSNIDCSPNAPNAQAAYAFSATLFAHFFEKKAAGTFIGTLSESDAAKIKDYSYAAWDAARTATHYTGAYTGGAWTPWAVPYDPLNRNWGSIGTSSEQYTHTELRTIVTRAGYTPKERYINSYNYPNTPYGSDAFNNQAVRDLATSMNFDFLFGRLRSNFLLNNITNDLNIQNSYDPGSDSKYLVLYRHTSRDAVKTVSDTAFISEFTVSCGRTNTLAYGVPNYIGISRAWQERPDLVFVPTWDEHLSREGYVMQAAMIYTLVTGGQNPLSSYTDWTANEQYALLLGHKIVKELGGLTSVAVPPIAYAGNASSINGAPVSITLSGFDFEGLPVTATNFSSPGKGTLSISGNTVTYTPNSGAVGQDTFTYRMSNGTLSSLSATVTINNLTQHVWSLETVTAGTTPDGTSGNTATLVNTPTQTAGYIGQALSFNGTNQYLTTAFQMTGPNVFTISAWVRTSTAGGKIIGFSGGASYDRHLYVNTLGQVVFGVYTGAFRTLTSPSAINDGNWHHVTASMSSSGMKLYVDGTRVASNTTTSGQSYTGKWIIGYDNLSSWPNAGSGYFNGALDDVRVYYRELSQSEVTALATPLTVVIGTQPANITATAGQTATFTVVATGTPAPTYQWQKGTTNISGATSSSYTTPATTLGDSGSTYRCVVSNSTGSVTSSSATLTVSLMLNRAGWIATSSAGGSPGNAIDGNAATRWNTGAVQANGQWFQVDMLSSQSVSQIVLDTTNSSGDYPRGYQVYAFNDLNNLGSAIATGTGSAVTTINFPAQNARYIRIVQTGTTTFNWWSIHEFNVYVSAPTIATQPANQTVTAGQTATFTVVATGTPALTYQWQKGTNNISGATSSSYTTPVTTVGDNDSTYRCLVTNGAGVVTSNSATLTVISKYDAWAANVYGLEGANALATADPDGDGVVNLVEYALGLSPVSANANPATLDQVVVNGSTYLRLSVDRDPTATDVLIEGLSSGTVTNPSGWSTTTTVIETNTASMFTVRDSVSIETGGKRFMRLLFSQP